MGNKAYEETSIQAIANAIRTKNGLSDTYTVGQMAQAIEDLPSGDDRLEKILQKQTIHRAVDISDLPITELRDYIFMNAAGTITSIKLPSTLVTIGNNAFDSQTIMMIDGNKLPDSITDIGVSAFGGCNSLVLTELPSSIQTIGQGAFQRCTDLSISSLPASLRSIGQGAFQQCSAVAITELPATVTSITGNAFKSCGIRTIDIKSALANSSLSIFATCPSLIEAKIRGTNLPGQLFYQSSNLQYVWISSNCVNNNSTSYIQSPFNGCTALTDIYCEAALKPYNWGNSWNSTASNKQATVHWGTTEEDFDAIVEAANA